MKYLFSFLIIVFLLSNSTLYSFANDTQMPAVPKTLEEAKTLGKEAVTGMPEALKKACQETLKVWKTILRWFKSIFDSYIFSWFKNIWQKIYSFLEKEVEKRKPEIKEEFGKEKKEMKEDIPRVSKSLWQRFKELTK